MIITGCHNNNCNPVWMVRSTEYKIVTLSLPCPTSHHTSQGGMGRVTACFNNARSSTPYIWLERKAGGCSRLLFDVAALAAAAVHRARLRSQMASNLVLAQQSIPREGWMISTLGIDGEGEGVIGPSQSSECRVPGCRYLTQYL